jgi:multimeric flavodoxin WrbA
MAKAVGEGARAAGGEVTLVNTNETRIAIEEYRKFDAVAFGTPDYFSYIAGGLKVFLDDWYIAKQSEPKDLENKPYALFYSHGGGGAVRGPFEQLFSGMGKKIGETIESRGRPGKAVLDACHKLGSAIAKAAKG